MIKINLLTKFVNADLPRQMPNENGRWDNYEFHINNNLEDCDYCVVFEDISKVENIYCDPKNTILITGEPPTIKKYKKGYLAQFNHIVTSHKNIRGRNVIQYQQSLPWHIGRNMSTKKNIPNMHYKDFVNITYEKTKLISIISSNKEITEEHRKRFEFAKTIKKHYTDQIDFYGRGFNEINNKWDAIAPYKYHIVLENCSIDNYWTEKLADCFLGGAYPLYHGCKNIFDYFDKNSLSTIDIENVNKSLDIIDSAISNNYYEKSIDKLKQSKNKILNEYNIFPSIIKIIGDIKCMSAISNKKNIKIKPENNFLGILSY